MSSKPWNREFRALEQRVPRLGTKSSGPWNKEFRALELGIFLLGMPSAVLQCQILRRRLGTAFAVNGSRDDAAGIACAFAAGEEAGQAGGA